jgi:hypothetical protein
MLRTLTVQLPPAAAAAADPSGQGNAAESAASSTKRPTRGFQITPVLCTGPPAGSQQQQQQAVVRQPEPPACWQVLAELYAALAEPDLLHLVQTAHLVKFPGEFVMHGMPCCCSCAPFITHMAPLGGQGVCGQAQL